MKTTATWSLVFGLWLSGCGDDSSAIGGSGGEPSGGGGAAAGGAPEGGAGGGGAEGGGGAGGAGGGATSPEALAFVRGTLFTSDLAQAQTYHDGLAQQGEAPAQAAGDFAHDTFLGTALLGTTENQFVAFDRWSSDTNMDGFYGDPTFQQAFGNLFSAPPTLETFLRSEFYGWGDLDSADATEPHYIVVVRGRLAGTPAEVQPLHDAVAQGGEAAALAAGDVAHVVHLGRADDREVVILDLWTDDANIEAFYSNPDFQAALAPLFEAPPDLKVYASNAWHQW